MDPKAVDDAHDLVAELFSHARWAALGGSVLTPYRTAGSDLDIVVLLPSGDLSVPHRASRYWRDWPVELFVHDVASLELYLGLDLMARKPTLHRMVGQSRLVFGDDPHYDAVQA